MAWMYAQTPFPNPKAGRPHEYIVYFGCQVIYPEAKKWMKLPGRLVHQYYTDWRDAAGPVHQDIHLTDQPNALYTVVGGKQTEVEEPSLAEAYAAKYGFQGVVFMPAGKDPINHPNLAKQLEEQSQATFISWVKECVETYRAQKEAAKSQGGLRMPSPWERHCFKLLGIEETFATADQMVNAQKPTQVTVNLTPEMIAAALEKATSPIQKEG